MHRALRLRGLRLPGLDQRDQVALANTPTDPSALNEREVDPMLVGYPPNDGGMECRPIDLTVGRGLSGRRWLGLGLLGHGRGAADLGDRRPDGHGLASLDQELRDGTAGRTGDLDVHLVGGHVGDRLVGLDRVALLLVPFEDGAFGDRLAHRGHRHRNGCVHGHFIGL
jgi:hypothetical protein